MFLFTLLIVGSHTVSGQGVYRYYDFNATQQAMIINEHNRLRALEPASDMQEMVWDANLAAMAKSWAGQCVAGHSSRQTRTDRFGYQKVGESYWLSSEPFLREDLGSVIRSFYSEKSLYTFQTRTCQPGKQCTHYTQVVWSTSCAVGCSAAYCANVINGGNIPTGHMVVCNYGPSGNMIGSDPYTVGKPCDSCPVSCSASRLCPSSCVNSPVNAAPFAQRQV